MFLQSWMKTQAYAKECILRLQKTMRVGQRKYPPHIVEVGAIQVCTKYFILYQTIKKIKNIDYANEYVYIF